MQFSIRPLVLALASVALLISQGAGARELIISNQSAAARLSGTDTELTVGKDKRLSTLSPNTTDRSTTDTQRLARYPEGTVVFVFRDDLDEVKGMLPVLPQSERLMSQKAASASKRFQPATSIFSVPETMVSRFHSTEVWRRSDNASLEYLGSIELNDALSP
jgi:hypothetical protein